MSIQKETKHAVRCHQRNLLNLLLSFICIIIALTVILLMVMSGSAEELPEENRASEEQKIGSMTREQYMKALERELRIREKEKRKEEKRKRRGRL